MDVRSWIGNIFGNKNTTPQHNAETLEIVEGQKAVFTPYKGDFHEDIDVLACVDAIARNGAKMHPRHIRNFKKGGVMQLDNVKGDLYNILAKKPNEIQNAYQFYYQVIANLELYNNAFIYMQRDTETMEITGLYPLDYNEVKLWEYDNKIFVQFKFGRSKERYVPYDDCIHLTRMVSKDGMFGGSTLPVRKVLDIKHILDEGIANAIKTTQSIKGILKSTKAMLKPEDVKKMRDQFVNDFVSNSNKSGIGGLDATTDFTPVKIDPVTADKSQIELFDKKILAYYGVSENIIQSNYSEDEWNAFYESVLEPIGLQMSLEFSNKIFTATQKAYGNEILFESNRLQYSSNKTKIELLRYANNIMTINELREVFNLAPREDGDKILQSLNYVDSSIANDYQMDNNVNEENNNQGGNNNEGN